PGSLHHDRRNTILNRDLNRYALFKVRIQTIHSSANEPNRRGSRQTKFHSDRFACYPPGFSCWRATSRFPSEVVLWKSLLFLLNAPVTLSPRKNLWLAFGRMFSCSLSILPSLCLRWVGGCTTDAMAIDSLSIFLDEATSSSTLSKSLDKTAQRGQHPYGNAGARLF